MGSKNKFFTGGFKMSPEEKSFYLDFYKKERELLFNAKLEQSKLFDKYIFAVSSAGLALSLTLLVNILKHTDYILFLITGWIFLVCSSIISLSSFLVSQKAIDKQLEILDHYIDCIFNEQKHEEQNNLYIKILNYFNISSFIMLIFLINVLKEVKQ